MKPFMNKDFLLKSEAAKSFYHNYASVMPIIDYHCHINPQEIAEDKTYENITQVWLYGDHYKWRAMRSNGIEEKYITGNASDYEKFEKWAETIPRLIGNPLYHWTHLELKEYFGYNAALSKETAKEVWELCNEKLKNMSARSIIQQSNVTAIGTTDDPIDSLEYHKQIAQDDSIDTIVAPTFRPDKAFDIEKESFGDYIKQLADVSGIDIVDVATLKQALGKRIDHFDEHGCKASDHSIQFLVCEPASEAEINTIFSKKANGDTLTEKEVHQFKTNILLFLGAEYAKRNWVMQLHYGVLRNNNSAKFEALGPDTGFDCIASAASNVGMVEYLDALEKDNNLPKTVIYSLNPTENAMIGSVLGCFQGENVAGKIQHGSAWWFNDTKHGMEEHMITLASLSVLGNFIGMLTDSRSFLSYTRHEYFRRILCNLIGGWVEDGEYPNDKVMLKELIQGISYNNTKTYFGF